ncbi:hypothetical protein ACIRVK_43560 [Streptomyces sp. NPDC101152]
MTLVLLAWHPHCVRMAAIHLYPQSLQALLTASYRRSR